MGQDHSKRTCGGPNPLVVELRARIKELEGVIEGGKKTIAGLEQRVSEVGQEAAEAERKLRAEMEEQQLSSAELRDASAAEYARQTAERDAEIERLTAETTERAARIEALEKFEAGALVELDELRPLKPQLADLIVAHDKLTAEHTEMAAEHKELRDSVEEEAIAQLENNMQRSQEKQSANAEHSTEVGQLKESIRLLQEQGGLDQAANAALEFKISRMEAELFGLRSLVGEDAAQSISQGAAKDMGFYEKENGTGLSPHLEALAKAGKAASGGVEPGGDESGRPEPLNPEALAEQIWGNGDMPTPPAQPDSPMSD